MSWEEASIAVYSTETRQYRVVLERGMDPSYSASGHVVYARDGTLFALPFDPVALEARGAPVQVARDVTTSRTHGQAEFALSRTGTLVYAHGGPWAEDSRALWVDRRGEAEPVFEETRPYVEARFSPDGEQLALTIEGGATSSIWSYDLSRRTLTLVAHLYDHYTPRWSPGGDRLAFVSNRDEGTFNVYVTAPDGAGVDTRLMETTAHQWLGSWVPDGERLVFGQYERSDTGYDIWSLSLGADRLPSPVLRTQFNERDPEISPDGRWMAYVGDDTGRDEVYVRRYPDASGRRQVSTAGGGQPRWHPDGSELFYKSGRRLVAVRFDVAEAPDLGAPTGLFERPADIVDYDVSRDGRRFVVLEAMDISAPTELILVQNWFEELRRLAP
jgi:serine/threonine-protein kinase